MYGCFLEKEQEYLAAVEIFADNFSKADQYVQELTSDGIIKGVIGPRESEIIWARHILNCGIIAKIIPDNISVADLGSGAGLPGIVLAIAKPSTKIILIEPLARRISWLESIAKKLNLDNIEIFHGRAQDAAKKHQVDIVTSRAVAELGKLFDLSFPLVKKKGQILAIKGKNVDQEIATTKDKIASKGGKKINLITLGEDILETPTTVVRIDIDR